MHWRVKGTCLLYRCILQRAVHGVFNLPLQKEKVLFNSNCPSEQRTVPVDCKRSKPVVLRSCEQHFISSCDNACTQAPLLHAPVKQRQHSSTKHGAVWFIKFQVAVAAGKVQFYVPKVCRLTRAPNHNRRYRSVCTAIGNIKKNEYRPAQHTRLYWLTYTPSHGSLC